MKAMTDIIQSEVEAVMKAKGYDIFTDEPNIVSVRNTAQTPDSYDDICFVWWSTESHNYTISTHPGLYYLDHPIAGTTGTAILVPGQYIHCWELGMHLGKQFALCQHLGQVRVYRDDRKDGSMTFDPATIDTGFFGIDIHHGALDDSAIVGPYSAGCQVFRYADAHEALMSKFKALNISKFSYSLLMQDDFQ